ncbi:Putative neutral zinc metallopeptidase [Rhodobacteraceae bacterium THAF1]|uniref:KPN_02809 family neutral zinc metallopeptidase n=1 Tax=Palleronia sp. THAF1 TaxID=2587842 RepID=UPI000F3E702A|nr:neutral zinc metallopeptidase [Palleronia sp. THAF1]QFU08403.1 Putative neutral zinc metallopeptidase [Palleronia sp. THAF1]VDC29185.1 Putative neutral zinc metallopeptidase [Rhodobacteraceae bacterium THAF1]
MQWRGRRQSRNIEDRRSRGGGSGGARVVGGGSLGILAIVVIGWIFGIDLTPLLQDASVQQPQGGGQITAADEERAQFVAVTLADTEEVWADVFAEQVGRPYDPATMVLFKGVTQSPCGGASGASGPFYCPADEKAYLDTDFFVTMERRLGAGGDFAAAYVVAHEIAHHVQDELGILSEANAIRQRVSEREANAISVRIELQADCFAGIWAAKADERFDSLDKGDVGEAMNAAKQIGDDTLQRNAGRAPNPHTFTHGTSEQRQRWFARGFDTGDMRECDTFSADRL